MPFRGGYVYWGFFFLVMAKVFYFPFKPKKGNQWSNLLLNSLDRVNASFVGETVCFLGDFFLFCFLFSSCYLFTFLLFLFRI
jgi:hypothetical protein